MPPELLTEGKLSRAADVYAFGVLVWEMATSSRAWAGMSHTQASLHHHLGALAETRLPTELPITCCGVYTIKDSDLREWFHASCLTLTSVSLAAGAHSGRLPQQAAALPRLHRCRHCGGLLWPKQKAVALMLHLLPNPQGMMLADAIYSWPLLPGSAPAPDFA